MGITIRIRLYSGLCKLFILVCVNFFIYRSGMCTVDLLADCVKFFFRNSY